MLATHPQPGQLRRADNLLPTAEGGLATRPGALQIIAADLGAAAPWGNRLLVETQGRLQLWTGPATLTDLAPAGRGLSATSFQALTSGGAREDRLYVAEGINPPWFIARRSGVYGAYDIANKVLNANGASYPIPAATAIATWRGRVWIAYGANRVQHCQFDDPDTWDPLWTPELQGQNPGRAVALEAHGEQLLVGLTTSTWTIAGDSHYNWQRNELSSHGVLGANAMVSDDTHAWWVAPDGLHEGATVLTEDLRELFAQQQYPAELVQDTRRHLLLLLVGGRLFAMHTARPGKWGEITGQSARGLFQLDDYVGWYGADGAWVLARRDELDKRLDGTSAAFTCRYDTWDDIPNPDGGGRALLARTQAVVLGSSRGNATYTATAADERGAETRFITTTTLADTYPDPWDDQIAGLDGEAWPTPPVRREFPAYLAGVRFRHEITAPCHMEVRQFKPDYRFGSKP